MMAKKASTERDRASLELLYSISRELTAQLDLRELLQRILKLTLSTVGAPNGSILVLDEKGETTEGALANDGELHDHTVEQLRDTFEDGLAGWVVENRKAALIESTHDDPRWLKKPDDKSEEESRSAISVPLLAHGRVVGVLTLVHPKADHFTDDDLALLTAIADQAGIAVSNAQLFAETRAARQRYAGLFEDNVDPILITDLEGRVTDANHRAVNFMGWSTEELLGKPILALHKPELDVLPIDLSKVKRGETLYYESEGKHREGSSLPIEVYVRRIDTGEDSFIQWILRDTSERIELAKLRADLTSMIFHDLRSPLGNIISSLEVMETSLPDGDEALHSVLSIASRSSRRASRLVESLLDLDRLETDKAVLNKSSASIGALIAEAVEEVHPTAEAKGQLLHLELTTGLLAAEMDVDMIRRVLINLLENAIKFTRGGGRIAISARASENQIQVEVTDSGPGIPPRDLERVFDKFTRLHQEPRPKGLGLGLAFCRLAVEAHGGRIWVESEEGVGSTFSFTLPIE